MPKKEILLTSEGFLELEEELNNLKTVERPNVIEAIKEARAQGDLSENADYDAARNKQAEVEARIKEIEFMMQHAKIIEKSSDHTVGLGSNVNILYVDDDEEETYSIVGSTEADPLENKISNESPLGMSIIGKKEGDIVEYTSPNGQSFQIKIVKVA